MTLQWAHRQQLDVGAGRSTPVQNIEQGTLRSEDPLLDNLPVRSLALPRPAAADEQTHQGKRTPGRREEEAAASGSAEKRLFPHLPMRSKQHPRAAASSESRNFLARENGK